MHVSRHICGSESGDEATYNMTRNPFYRTFLFGDGSTPPPAGIPYNLTWTFTAPSRDRQPDSQMTDAPVDEAVEAQVAAAQPDVSHPPCSLFGKEVANSMA